MVARAPNAPPPGAPPLPAVDSSSDGHAVSWNFFNLVIKLCRNPVECRTVFRFDKRFLELELKVYIFNLKAMFLQLSSKIPKLEVVQNKQLKVPYSPSWKIFEIDLRDPDWVIGRYASNL
jgi:hypothetical protein